MSVESNVGCACAEGIDEVEAVVPDVMDCGESAGALDPPVEDRCCKKLGALLTLVLTTGLTGSRDRGVASLARREESCTGVARAGVDAPFIGI
jgi:hypothetical protein